MPITNKLIWKIFIFSLLVIFLHSLCNLLGIGLEKYLRLKILILGLPVVLLLLHSFLTLSLMRGALFILLASLTGLVMEVWGLSAGTFFGGHYVYRLNQLTILQVPLSVVVYWVVFIYTGYCIVASFFYWLNKEKPNKKQKNFWLLPIAIFLDGLIVVVIDLFMDPLQVRLGSWQWLEGGPYFGVPIGNFIGWFIVTVIVTGIYRSYEYFFNTQRYRLRLWFCEGFLQDDGVGNRW